MSQTKFTLKRPSFCVFCRRFLLAIDEFIFAPIFKSKAETTDRKRWGFLPHIRLAEAKVRLLTHRQDLEHSPQQRRVRGDPQARTLFRWLSSPSHQKEQGNQRGEAG